MANDSNDSCVLHVSMLDAEHASQFKSEWLHELPDGTIYGFDSEEEACEDQRAYRRLLGLNEHTGAKQS